MEDQQLEKTRGWGGDVQGKGSAYSIGVAVRVRPMSSQEMAKNCLPLVKMMDEKVVVLMDPSKVVGEEDYLRRDRNRERHFAFDYAFDENASQEHVYRRTTRKLLPGVLDGFNASCFAYGATGTGKTYTMLGDFKRVGIMVQTVAELFSRISQIRDKKYRVYLSYLEVYNENIRDLLTPSSSYLELREEPIKGISVAGITEFATTSADETIDLLHRGNLNRSVEPTKKNETSSRSHAVLQIMVEQQDRTADVSTVVKIGKLSLIDLAGSERASHTENRGQRLLEGANINRSLLALANCINALAGDVKGKRGAVGFVPYRDSKLTRLLKDSFGGNTRTVMIANLSPAHDQFEETLNTLKYANRAKNIKTRITQNLKGVSYHISEYKRIISELRSEVKELKGNLHRMEEERGVPPGVLPSLDVKPHSGSGLRSPMRVKEKDEAHKIAKQVSELFTDRTGLVMRLSNLEEDLWNLKLDKQLAEVVHGGEYDMAKIDKECEEKSSSKAAVKERLEAQSKHANELLELARQKLHSSRLQHVELVFRNSVLTIENMELQMVSRARVKLMERAVTEMQKHPGVALEIPDLPKQSKSRGTPSSTAIAAGLSIDIQSSFSSGEQQLFSKSRRGRIPTAEPTDGLDLHAVSDGEHEISTSLQRPVALTQDVKTPKGRRRRQPVHESMDNSLFSSPDRAHPAPQPASRRPRSAKKFQPYQQPQPQPVRSHHNDHSSHSSNHGAQHHDSDAENFRRNQPKPHLSAKPQLPSPRNKHGGAAAGQRPSYAGSYVERKERESMIFNMYDPEGHLAPSPTHEKPKNIGNLALLRKKQVKGRDRFATDSEIQPARPSAGAKSGFSKPVAVSYKKMGSAFPPI